MELENRLDIMEEQFLDFGKKLDRIYNIIVGEEENKEFSMLMRMQKMADKIETLEVDKIRRDATLKTFIFLSGLLGTILGSIIAYLINNHLK